MKPPQLLPNVVIADKYRLLRPLGEGAMGVVWAASNVLTSRQVALKLIVDPDEELRRRMLREARACGALQHRNIVDILDVAWADDGNPILVMQLLMGETLADLLARSRRLPPARAAAIGRDVAGALAAAHAIGVVHRDVKPANIFLHDDGGGEPIVKVLDFGVSKDLRGGDSIRTVTGGIVGSPSYMSPEQARADSDIDGRADIWSLGVTLFEMLTGTLPFDGSVEDVLRQIFTAEIPVVARRIRTVDPALSDLVARCMERDRTRRIASAEELASQLDALSRAPSPPRTPEVSARAQDPASHKGPVAQVPMPTPARTVPGGGPPSVPAGSSPPGAALKEGEPADAETLRLTGAGTPGSSPGVTSSTAPFARAAPGAPFGAPLLDPPATPNAAHRRRAARVSSPVVIVGLAGAACAVGALLVALPSFQTPPLDSPSPAPTITSAPGAITTAATTTPPSDPATTAAPDSPPAPTAESDLDDPAPPGPDGGAPRPSRWTRPAVTGAPTSTVPTGDGSFNRGAAQAAMGAAAANVKSCKKVNGPTGPGSVRVLFQSDGTAAAALVGPPYGGTPSGACIASLFRTVRVPPFRGESVMATKSFNIP